MSATCEPNAKNKLKRIFRQRSAETNQIELADNRNLLLRELYRHKSKDKQLTELEFWLRKCDGEIFRYRMVISRLRTKESSSKEAEIKLASLLDLRALLRTELLRASPSR